MISRVPTRVAVLVTIGLLVLPGLALAAGGGGDQNPWVSLGLKFVIAFGRILPHIQSTPGRHTPFIKFKGKWIHIEETVFPGNL